MAEISRKTFVGKAGGDCECFCWFVTEEVYRQIRGDEDADSEWKHFRDNQKDFPKMVSHLTEPAWLIYPGSIIGREWDDKRLGKPCKFTVIVEEVDA